MRILGAILLYMSLPGLAFAQHAGTSFGGGSGVPAISAGGGAGGSGGGGGTASMTHVPTTQFHYPAAHNDGSFVPSGFVPFSQAVKSAKPSPEAGMFLPFDEAVEAGREANQPSPSLGDVARRERARREHEPQTN
jgi:hypothetical protein